MTERKHRFRPRLPRFLQRTSAETPDKDLKSKVMIVELEDTGIRLYRDSEVAKLTQRFDPKSYGGPQASLYGDASVEAFLAPFPGLGYAAGEYFGFAEEDLNGVRNTLNRVPAGVAFYMGGVELRDVRTEEVDGKKIVFPTARLLKAFHVQEREGYVGEVKESPTFGKELSIPDAELVQERLRDLKELRDDLPEDVYEFAELLAERLKGGGLVPTGFIIASTLLIYDLQRGINGITKEPINNRLANCQPMLYSFLTSELSRLAEIVAPGPFAREVGSKIEKADRRASRQAHYEREEFERAVDQPAEQARHFKEVVGLGPNERARYYDIPGWRIWAGVVFGDKTYFDALAEVQSNSGAIVIPPDNSRAWKQIEEKMARISHRSTLPSIAFDLPSYILEPLTEEFVEQLDRDGRMPGPLGTIDLPEEIVRPEELRSLIEA